ncbi:DUF3649 domain-containing protein [Alcaligenes ammonioxydans]
MVGEPRKPSKSAHRVCVGLIFFCACLCPLRGTRRPRH